MTSTTSKSVPSVRSSKRRGLSLPPVEHVPVALAVAEALAAVSAAGSDQRASLPTDVRKALDYFDQVATFAETVSRKQPQMLAGYRDGLIDALTGTLANVLAEAGAGALGDGPEVATACAEEVVDTVLASYVMAQLVADVADGKVAPVTVRGRARSSAGSARTRKPAAVSAASGPADQPSESGETGQAGTDGGSEPDAVSVTEAQAPDTAPDTAPESAPEPTPAPEPAPEVVAVQFAQSDDDDF